MTQLRHINLLTAILFSLICTAAQASPTTNEKRVAISFMDFGYKEFDDEDVVLNSEDGLLPGITLKYG